MIMFSNRTINYAAPPSGSFWAWSADYDAIEWYDGSTLAMWQELHGVLKFLGEDSGLPPLGAVLLLLAACRDEWLGLCIPFHGKVMEILECKNNDSISLGYNDSPLTFTAGGEDETRGDGIPMEIKDTLVRGLKAVNDLPKDLRSSFPAKCLLLSALFEGGPHSLAKNETSKILIELSLHGPMGLHGSFPQMDARARFIRDVRALKVGLGRHDAASLEARLRTGLEDCEIQPPPIDDSPAKESRPLLDRLANAGGECGAAAAVAKRTIAMMNFPGSFGKPDGLPVGGISDITNRGTVDRLLPGELAWDDLVLAVRLVHNEALYFRREIPPQDLTVSHTVLLDRGLRLWGTGRVVALGVALGLRHHPALSRPGASFECVAASVDGFDYLDLASPAGVYSALEELLPAPGPDTFLSAWRDFAVAVDDDAVPDVSFVTSEAHLGEASTLGLLCEIATWIYSKGGCFRVVALGRDGGFEVRIWSPGGNRIQFRGDIDLGAIFKKPPESPQRPIVPKLRSAPDPLHDVLPIYGLEKFPFLFPQIPQGSAILPCDNSPDSPVIGVSSERQLMRWPKTGWGGEELVTKVPGRQHWMGWDDNRAAIVIASGRVADDSVQVFRVVQDILVEISICKSQHPFPRFATVSGGAVLIAYSDSVEAISLSSGNRVSSAPIEKLPANPVLHYDGEKIMMIDAGADVPPALKKWPFGDPSWPRLFVPDGVAIVSGSLRARCGEVTYGFSPPSMTWDKVKTANALFSTFEKCDFTPNSMVTLGIARIGNGMEVWLDSRGIIHLRQPANSESPWSILLCACTASAWHSGWGLCTREPRLQYPDAKIHNVSAHAALRDFLTRKPV